MEVAFRLPWMGDPYGGPCGGGFGAAGGQHVQAPPPASAEWRSSAGSAGPTWGPTTNPRKRGWDEHGSAADERSVRLCALSNFCGGGSVVGGAGPSPAQLSGQKPGHGAWQETTEAGLESGRAFDMQPSAFTMHLEGQQMQHPSPLQSPQHRNAFDLLMSSQPIKVDGVVCARCLTQEARTTTPCFHCAQPICQPCL